MASISLKEIAKNMKVNSFKFSDMNTKLFAGSSDGTFSIKNFYNRTLNQDYYIFKNKADFDSKINGILTEYNNDLSSISIGFENGLENENIIFPASIIKSPITIYADRCVSALAMFKKTNLEDYSNDIFCNMPNIETFKQVMAFTNIKTLRKELFKNNYKVTSLHAAFQTCYELQHVDEEIFYNMPLLENALGLFYFNTKLKNIPEKIFFKNTKITTIENLLCNSGILSLPENLLNYNKNLISVNKAFAQLSITNIPESLFFNNPNIEDASFCFGRNIELNNIPEKLFFYNKKLITVSNCFCGVLITSNKLENYNKIKKIPENLFINNELLEDVSWCFSGTQIEYISSNLFKNNVNLKNVSKCFNYTKLKEVPLGLFDNNPNIEDASFCFNYSQQLEIIPEGLFSNKQKLKNISSCFQITNVKIVPQNLLKNSANIEDASYLFHNVYDTTTVDEHLFDDNLKIKTFKQCFYNDSNITSKIPVVWDIEGVDLTKYAYNCTKALNYNDIPSNARGIMENNNYLEENIDNDCYTDCLGDEDLE